MPVTCAQAIAHGRKSEGWSPHVWRREAALGPVPPCPPAQGRRSKQSGIIVGPAFQWCLGFRCWLHLCAGQELCGLKVAFGARLVPLLCPCVGQGQARVHLVQGCPKLTGDASFQGKEAGHGECSPGGSAGSHTAYPPSAQAVNWFWGCGQGNFSLPAPKATAASAAW